MRLPRDLSAVPRGVYDDLVDESVLARMSHRHDTRPAPHRVPLIGQPGPVKSFDFASYGWAVDTSREQVKMFIWGRFMLTGLHGSPSFERMTRRSLRDNE